MNNQGNDSIFMNGKRTSSRVLDEPGGKSSVQLSWDSPKQKQQKITTESKETENTSSSSSVSSNVFADGNSQNNGNVLTNRPTSKVTQPPGGRSSVQFG
jgi:hypothetical protein